MSCFSISNRENVPPALLPLALLFCEAFALLLFFLSPTAEAQQDKSDVAITLHERGQANSTTNVNWRFLFQYIDLALPQPNGSHLNSYARQRYWNESAKDAYDLYDQLQVSKNVASNGKSAAQLNYFVKRNLIQINIVGVNALYVDDLVPYFRKLRFDSDSLSGMTDHEKESVISIARSDGTSRARKRLVDEGGAWVVELRFYTCHKYREEFVLDTILENLRSPTDMRDAVGALLEVAKPAWGARAAYFHLYKTAVDKSPERYKFKIIGQSYLKALAQGLPDSVPFGVPPAPSRLASRKSTRGSWRPLGEVARGVFESTHLPLVADQNVRVTEAPARSEYVLVFIWRESIFTHKERN